MCIEIVPEGHDGTLADVVHEVETEVVADRLDEVDGHDGHYNEIEHDKFPGNKNVVHDVLDEQGNGRHAGGYDQ